MASFAVIGAIAGTVATLLFVGSALPMLELIRVHPPNPRYPRSIAGHLWQRVGESANA